MDLIEFLFARIAEDEALATITGPREWCRDEDTVVDRLGDSVAAVFDYADDGQIAAHIARHDPDQVLAECDAKRQIIAEHPAAVSRRPRSRLASLRQSGPEPTFCATCGDPDFWDQVAPVDWPCRTLRFLAGIYSDHPDYREEWAV